MVPRSRSPTAATWAPDCRAPQRPGATASALLSGPFGLTLRLQRGTLLGWGAGLFTLSAAMGSLSREVGDMARGNATLEKYLQASGQGSLTDAFFSRCC